jgi:hypothetical protein
METPQTIYIETSIVSYLASRPSRYQLVTSELVIAEARAGDAFVAAKHIEHLKGIPELALTFEVNNLAKALLSEGALPLKAEADALHIALAAVHQIDLLLTWNCRHIDNPATKPIIRSVCAVAGFSCPEICTPFEILEVRTNEE